MFSHRLDGVGYRIAKDLESIRAHGQVGRQWIYFFSHGEQHRREYKIPDDPQTPRQLAKRGFFWQAHQYWNNLTENEKDFYHDKAKVLGRLPAGLQYFLSLWLRGLIVQETVRSVQRGRLVCVDGINDVTIVEVAVAKTQVNVSSYSCNQSLGAPNTCNVVGGVLASSTNLQIEARKGTSAPDPIAYWEVVEFY